jgi:hypothetical protein
MRTPTTGRKKIFSIIGTVMMALVFTALIDGLFIVPAFGQPPPRGSDRDRYERRRYDYDRWERGRRYYRPRYYSAPVYAPPPIYIPPPPPPPGISIFFPPIIIR